MALFRSIDRKWYLFHLQASALLSVSRHPLSRADQRQQVRGRSGVLNDSLKAFRQPEELPHPISHVLLDFCQRRAGLPVDPQLAQPRTEQISEHRGELGVGRKVTEEARVLEVRQTRTQDGVDFIDQL